MPLPTLVNLKLGSSLHSCDQCNQRRRRCDRKMPSCGQCTFREVGCSYKRQLKRCQVLVPDSDSATPFSEATSDLVVIPFQVSKPNYEQVRMGASLTAEAMASQWTFTASGFIDHLKGRRGSSDQPIYLARACMAPILPADALWIKKKDHPFSCFLQAQSLQGSTVKRDLDRALEAYFAHINPFSPLFVRRCFFARRRSELLMVAIWLSGSLHVQGIDQRTISTLKSRLHLLGKLSSLRPNLDTLQFLLVILVGMRGIPGLDATARLCHNLSHRLATCLGLHSDMELKCPVFFLERRLACNMVVSTDATRGWGLRLPYLRSNDYCSPASSYQLLAHYDKASRLCPASGNTSWDTGCLYFSNYMYETSDPIYDTHLLYGKIERGEPVNAREECSALIQHIQDISLDQTRRINQSSSLNCDPTAEAYISAGFMFTRLLSYAAASLVPMAHSSQVLNQVAIDWALQAISSSLQLPSDLAVFEGRVFLTTAALTFIIRSQATSNASASEMFKKGYHHLKAFKQHKGFLCHTKDNLSIIDNLLTERNLTHLIT